MNPTSDPEKQIWREAQGVGFVQAFFRILKTGPVIAGSLLLAAGLVLATTVPTNQEPLYAGKTVDQWLNAGQEDVCFAMHEIGLPALPYILRKLAREDPQSGSYSRYRQLWQRLPKSVRAAMPRPKPANFDQTRACGALIELGPKLIPQLKAELRNKNPAIRNVSAQVLGLWAEHGKNIESAVPLLALATEDSDLQVRSSAAAALRLSRPKVNE